MATNWKTLDPNTWAKVNEGACALQKSGPWEVKVFIGTNDPDDSSPYGLWSYGDFNYEGDENVYLKCREPTRITIFT